LNTAAPDFLNLAWPDYMVRGGDAEADMRTLCAEAAVQVPAYRTLLKNHGLDPDDSMGKTIAESICRQCRHLNSEFANYIPDALQMPVLTCLPHRHPEYFPPGVKHRYTQKPT